MSDLLSRLSPVLKSWFSLSLDPFSSVKLILLPVSWIYLLKYHFINLHRLPVFVPHQPHDNLQCKCERESVNRVQRKFYKNRFLNNTKINVVNFTEKYYFSIYTSHLLLCVTCCCNYLWLFLLSENCFKVNPTTKFSPHLTENFNSALVYPTRLNKYQL